MAFENVELRISSSKNKKRILVVGSSNIDTVFHMKRMPSAGETVVDGGTYSTTPGGKGANAALAIARLGADCVFCTKLGNDENGVRLKKFYGENCIDTRAVCVDKSSATGLAAIMVEGDGTNRIIVYPGANLKLTKENIEEAFMCYPDALYLSFELPLKNIYDACEIAHRHGVPIFIDGGPAFRGFCFEKLPPIEVFSPNETETYIYTGIKPQSMNDCLRAASALFSKMTVKYIVIKLGNRGCFVYDGIHYYICASYEVDAVDTTAAGDAFTAAMTSEYVKGESILKACEFANAAGALTVSKCGSAESIPTRDEILKLMNGDE